MPNRKSGRNDHGQFLRTPQGVKTPRMLEVEATLGRTLEEDYQEFYLEKRWGQKRLATRWGVARSLVFSSHMRGRRRSWVQMLGLTVRHAEEAKPSPGRSRHRPECEICGWSDGPLDGAHFIPYSEGGSRGWNILRLCPNCHRRLDSHDKEILERAKGALLERETRRILAEERDPSEVRRRLLWLAKKVVQRTS